MLLCLTILGLSSATVFWYSLFREWWEALVDSGGYQGYGWSGKPFGLQVYQGFVHGLCSVHILVPRG